MKALVCKNCGANGLRMINGYAVCDYCDSKFRLTAEDFSFSEKCTSQTSSATRGISLGNDVEMLLQKCRMNPKNAKRYANLILDIDPDNEEALRYL